MDYNKFSVGAKEAKNFGLDKDIRNLTPLQYHIFYIGIFNGFSFGLILGGIVGILMTYIVILSNIK